MENLAAHNSEHEKRKAEIAKQRADMKIELQRQVEVKREIALAQKRTEQAAFSKDIAMNDQRRQEEEARRVQTKAKYLKEGNQIKQQVKQAANQKEHTMLSEKEQAVRER